MIKDEELKTKAKTTSWTRTEARLERAGGHEAGLEVWEQRLWELLFAESDIC